MHHREFRPRRFDDSMEEQSFEPEVKEDYEEIDEKAERRLVIPGEVIASGDSFLPGDFTRKEGNDVIANRFGLAEISSRVIKIIPISGVYEPRRRSEEH